MTAKDALLAIAARALAQRNNQAVEPTGPNDRGNKFNQDRPELFIRGKRQGGRVSK